MNAADILRAAANKLEGGHWIQYELAVISSTNQAVSAADPDADRWCAWGAVRSVAPRGRYTQAQNRAITALTNFTGTTSLTIGRWNDTPGRTEAEVVAALRSAAASLD